MKVGVPTEIKTDEYRVSLTPAGARELVEHGHEVIVQSGAGEGSHDPGLGVHGPGRPHRRPTRPACSRRPSWSWGSRSRSRRRWRCWRPDHLLFTYLHLAPDPDLTRGLAESGATCVAYETVVDERGRLPLLAPMSEVAGKIATQAGAFFLERPLGGRGVLLGGVPGVAAATVMIIGGGVVGQNAAFIAIGMEADVFVFDRNIDRLRELDIGFGGRASTVYSSTLAVEQMLPQADLVIGAVLVHGARAPYVIKRDQLGADEEARRAGRRLDRPGRLLRDLAPDHPLGPRLRGRRGDPLLRGEHARRRAGHLDLRPDQRHAAVRARARRRGARRSARRRCPD